jgi:predicted amino acid dehydrogenase
MKRERKIAVVNFLEKHPVREESVEHGEIHFQIREFGIGWDFDTAETLVKNYDGYVDGFALSGLQKHLGTGDLRISHPGYLRLIRSAIKTPIYSADDVRAVFSEWTLNRLLKEQPQVFQGKRVLFHSALVSPSLPQIKAAGASIFAADPLMLSGTKLRLKGPLQMNLFFKTIKPLVQPILFNLVNPSRSVRLTASRETLGKWIRDCDIFVTFGAMLSQLETFKELEGKLILSDYVDAETREKLEASGVAQVLEFIPDQLKLQGKASRSFSILAAMIDQRRIVEDSPLALNEYLLKWFEKTGVTPNRLKSYRGIKRRCAFIIHPLTQRDIWKAPGMGIFRDSPEFVRKLIEKGAARVPCFHVGAITGSVSAFNGQEVDCDIYAIAATPREILSMDEEFLYRRLIDCVEMARKRGAAIVGLGAYTKIVGDAGVTIARRSSIPVTNGNSYSASTTLWAAREMVERLGLISPERQGQRFKAKATIIGATGSIGRVSSLLVSLVFQDVALVANRPDKLLELREEILALSPGVKVHVTTRASSVISDSDLIVTATSNQTGSVLDIDLVKPGAVICDCSRPLDITTEMASRRPDILVIESGEVMLPGETKINVDIGLPPPSVFACTAETVLLAMEGRFESFSLSKQLSLEKTKEIYRLGVKHGAKLAAIQGPLGLVTDETIETCRTLALERLKTWKIPLRLEETSG